MRTRRKTDSNHAEIMSAFRSLGCEVADTSQVHGGFPDQVVSLQGRNYLVEAKGVDGRITKDQLDFADRWSAPIYICRHIDTVPALVGFWRGFGGEVEVMTSGR